MANDQGMSLLYWLSHLNEAVNQANYRAAHNISFDEKIMGADLLRKDIASSFEVTAKLCTMKASTAYCKIPGRYGYKWPTLAELHIKLFGEDFEDAHDALVDISITEKCFWELKNRGVL